MKNVIKKTLHDIKPYIPGKPIEEVRRELGIKDVIKLASNENPYGPSPKVIAAIRENAPFLNRYPDGDCFYLREALAKHLNVGPRQLIFGNGSDEIIVLAVRALVEEGNEVIIAKPSFLVYDIASRIAGAHIKFVPLKNDFHYDLDRMKRSITPKTRIVFLGNPDNPGGMYLTHKQLQAFMIGIPEDVLIFVDEAYFEYVHQKDYADTISLIKKYKNLIATRTFSKMYGLAGLRVGYGVGNEELIGYLNRLREPFNINSLAQVAARACLKDQAYYRGLAKKVEGQRSYLYKNFQKFGFEFVKSFTNFVLVKVGAPSSLVAQKLLHKGVIVRDMTFWGMDNYIRVTIGTDKENQKLVKALGESI